IDNPLQEMLGPAANEETYLTQYDVICATDPFSSNRQK
ncbi:unnamed protein product, partial [marine sediment metagenome]